MIMYDHVVLQAPVGEGAPAPLAGLDEMSPEHRAEAEATWEAEKAEADTRWRRRVAAATLLQRRVPELLQRARAIRAARERATAWAPWLARLNSVSALLSAAEGRALQLARAKAAAEAAEVQRLEDVAASAAVSAESRSVSPSKVKAGAAGAKPPPAPKAAPAPKSPTPAPGRGSPLPPGAPAEDDSVAPDMTGTPQMLALVHLARSAQLASRGRAWHELLNAARQLFNVGRALLNTEPAMSKPTPALVWEMAQLPPPPTAPVRRLSTATLGSDPLGRPYHPRSHTSPSSRSWR